MEKILSWFNSEFKSWFSSQFTALDKAQSEAATLKASLQSAQATIAERDQSIADLTKAATESKTALAGKDAEIANLQEKLTTAETKAQEVLASQGLPANSTPDGSLDGAGEKTVAQQVAALRKTLSASTDPKEKFKLSNQIRELLSKKN